MWSTACALVDWGKLWYDEKRKRGRVVEGARLEIVWAGDRLGGSNPLASANYAFLALLAQMRFFVFCGIGGSNAMVFTNGNVKFISYCLSGSHSVNQLVILAQLSRVSTFFGLLDFCFKYNPI